MSKKNQVISLVIIGVLALGGGFFGGMQYGGSSGSQGNIRGGDVTANLTGQFQDSSEHGDWNGDGQHRSGGNHPGRISGPARGRDGRALVGEVLGVEDGALTLKTQDGGSKIIFFAESTQVREIISGSVDDALEGEQIVVFGQENPDGSYSAQAIQFGLPAWAQ